MSTNVVMPEMGEGVVEGTIVRWLKRVGDTVKRDDPILEIETDKVTVEVTAQTNGVLLKVNVAEGKTVSAGTVLAVIGEPGEKVEARPVRAAAPAPAVAVTPNAQTAERSRTNHVHTPTVEAAPTRTFDDVRVSPVVARMLQVHDLDVHELKGTGRDGRITKQDVLAYLETHEDQAEALEPAAPETPAAAPTVKMEAAPAILDAGDELMPLTGMRRSIAEHMVRSKHTSPHVTTVFEFDFAAVTKHREAHKEQFARDGVKLTYMPYLVLATVQALKKHRMANAAWSDDGIVLKRDIHLGMAVAVSSGLLVPVIRNADRLNLFGLAQAVNDLSERARNNRLKSDELRGGTFTITNHGVSGSLIGTPIINQPQVGILGVGLIEKRLKVIDDAIMIRPCAYISFSFDHRVLDGASADAFVADIKNTIENFS